MKFSEKEFIRTDLAVEDPMTAGGEADYSESEIDGFNVHKMTVSEDYSKKSGLSPGKYYTVTVGKLWLYSRENVDKAANLVSKLILELCEPYISEEKNSVLVVCLGNRRITSDSVGPLCSEKIIVTRHLKTENEKLYHALSGHELSVITPGVTGETGIESFELIYSAVKTVKPAIVVAIDALAARHVDRLATTVQLTDTGISPGSGVGNKRKAINYKTLKVPVVTIGVPTVVQSATLVWDALSKAGITEPDSALSEVLENEKSFFVTPKETDVAVEAQAELISAAINMSFLGFARL